MGSLRAIAARRREGQGGPPNARSEPRDASAPSLVTREEVSPLLVAVFALVGEAIAGATHALLACDREAAKQLTQSDDVVHERIATIARLTERAVISGAGTPEQRQELVTILRMLPDLDRNADLAEHIARRAARGLGSEMSPRSRGMVERMGEVAAAIWASAAEAVSDPGSQGSSTVDAADALDDEMDELHVGLSAELAAGTMEVPVAIELALVARFYERFGDHAVNLVRRIVNPGHSPRTRAE